MEANMRASSDTIAQLAAALAKAQSELVNPAKSLTAILDDGRSRAGPQCYRYAPLSSGLDIVRKAFGKFELALIQTTHVDRDRSILLLTTTIAHGSGEWISGLWPVCSLSEMGHPKLMGAALTYARRYCLFTMVGIAGEDDIDAPDFPTTEVKGVPGNGFDPDPVKPAIDLHDRHNSTPTIEQENADPSAEPSVSQDAEPARRRRRGARISPPSPLPSAKSTDPLGDLATIADAETLFRWALEVLPARNKLDEKERVALDAAFLAKAEAIGADPELLTPFAASRASSPLAFHPGMPE
jgi:hypothetical protein